MIASGDTNLGLLKMKYAIEAAVDNPSKRPISTITELNMVTSLGSKEAVLETTRML
jgi:hypothetical protein